MGKIKVLDCTLRDGGRIIDCNFGKDCIQDIVGSLLNAGIDIIELGFIRDKITYKNGSTFFTDIEQVKKIVKTSERGEFVLFADFGMFDVNALPLHTLENPITGIRLGFKKGEFDKACDEMEIIINKGYHVFLQDVDTPGYSEKEMLYMISKINEIKPCSFAIVDTYGRMYEEDLMSWFDLINKNLSPDIAIDFHSHNNFQLSFSLAQKIVKAAGKTRRDIIIDATLYGMGKVAGNLNTELIVDYLNRKFNKTYDLNIIFDIIDEKIMKFYQHPSWGYSANGLLSGKYVAHPNNVIYLTEKYKLDTNDIEKILKLIDDDKRKTYDYDNIEKCYIEYNSRKCYKEDKLEPLIQSLENKKILIIAPGSSVDRYKEEIDRFINNNNPVIISISFEYETEEASYAFFTSQKRYKKYIKKNKNTKVILTSNIKSEEEECIYIDFNSVVKRGWDNFDNAAIMLLRFLLNINIIDISIAGFDGFSMDINNFTKSIDLLNSPNMDYEKINKEILTMFWDVRKEFRNKGVQITFLTPSIYEIHRRR